MNTEVSGPGRLERLLAELLHYGTWLASTVIAVGIVLALIERHAGVETMASLSGMRIVTAGIALFILLPAARVIVMLIVFVHERDFPFIVIAVLVLVIVLLGFALGMYMPSPMQSAH